MAKKKWFILLVVFFLGQGLIPLQALSFESIPLNSFTNIDINYFDQMIKNIHEDSLAKTKVTFAAMPSLNEILSDCKIKPLTTYSSSEVNRSL